MKHYKLTYLPLFSDDLNEIVHYIAVVLKNPTAADKLVNDVEKAIQERLSMPEAFARYPSAKEREFPYYAIYVRNFTVFYVVKDDTMEVRRILYSKRNICQIL